MSFDEIRCRSRQEGAKWIDRFRTDGGRDPIATLQRHAPALADAGQARVALQRNFERHFFKGVNADVIATLRNRLDVVAGIIQDADAILEGRFNLLGYEALTFGTPIDWHLDPVWNRQSPPLHWSQIDALDPTVVGDSKVVWELNRHQWMVTLAQASALTGDDKYAAFATENMLDWIAANPVGRGINWASSLEVALRLISWTWVLALLRDSKALTDEVVTTVLASIREHANHVHRYLSFYYSPNTHLTGEALGLFYAGTQYPEFDDATLWRDSGSETLIAQALRQISADGVYFEQSTCYQRYSCDFYLHFLLLAERAGISVPSHVVDRVMRMIDVLDALRGVDGSMPSIGDADGGWLMPLTRRKGDDCEATLAVASVVFNRPDLATSDAPEALWLSGIAPQPAQHATVRTSQVFTEGGYAVLRSHEHQLIVDVGPLGSYGHGHADLLSVQCTIFGERCLVDPGTYGYTAEPVWREYFRGTAAHNTITVDGASQAPARGPFGWNNRPVARIREWASNQVFDLIDAEHDAYPGVIHRRRVMVLKPSVFAIVDDLLGDSDHAFELAFQFAPMDVALTGTAARATTPRGHALWVMPFTEISLSADIVTGQTTPPRGWVSADYGLKTPAPALIYSGRTALPVRIVTLLFPQLEPSNEPPLVAPIFDALSAALKDASCAASPAS